MSLQRSQKFAIHGKQLQLPAYFPSVSSLKTAMAVESYVEILASSRGLSGHFLVSAFDLENLDDPIAVGGQLKEFRDEGGIVMIDSGNYESFWKGGQEAWGIEQFHDALRQFPCDLSFSFDNLDPPECKHANIRSIVSGWEEDQQAASDCCIIPIVHGTASDLPTLCASVAKETGVKFVAVAERRLGQGILSRAAVVQSIRTALNELGDYVCLHLLGTGNPFSLAIFSAMGADSFDGLEWCQTVVDHDAALLHHLSHADFFDKQTDWGSAVELSSVERVLMHNVEFFCDWMKRLREAIMGGHVVDFCKHNLPDRVFRRLLSEEQLDWDNPMEDS